LNATWPAAKADDNDVLKNMSAYHPKASALKNTLPMIPGYGSLAANRHDFRKHSTMEQVGPYQMIYEVKKPAAEFIPSMEKISLTDIKKAHPSWLTLENKILRFFAYYKEGIHESAEETSRIRRCNIYYYLEDDTIQVTEPKQDNSGVWQGRHVKRHRIPKVHGTQEFYCVDDLDVGNDVVIYSRVYHIVDCDAFTRYFYSQLGRSLKPFEDYPEDKHTEMQATRRNKGTQRGPKERDEVHTEMKRFIETQAGGTLSCPTKEEVDLAQSFYENDGKVLQFDAVWDDRNTPYGDLRKFQLLFFLADKTVKIVEKPGKDGRGAAGVFLKRCKLAQTNNPAADQQPGCAKPQTYVTDTDLGIGKTILVNARNFLITDCDAFTKRYYAERYQEYEFNPIDFSEPPKVVPKMKPPRHFGIGSPEDSLVSWKHLVLKPPKKDLKRMTERAGDVLRFGGYIESQPERRMMLVFWAADDTCGIFAQPGRNTGFASGKFLQRQRVKKPVPGNATLTGEAPYYDETDFYVGARLNINGHIIILDQTDERTVNYLEGVPKEFTLEDMNMVMAKFRQMLLERFSRLTDAFRTMDQDHDGSVTVQELELMCKHMNLNLTQHELLTLMNYMDEDRNGTIEFAEFVRRICPKDYEGELDEGKGVVPVTEIAPPVDSHYAKIAYGKQQQAEANKVFKMFRDKLQSMKFEGIELFRLMSDRAFDSMVGEKEFTYAVEKVLQLHLTEPQMDTLLKRFFPFEGKRLDYKNFNRIMNSGPHFETTKM